MTSILVTGSAGFIGFHVSKRLLAEGFRVTGLDNLNDYYDVNLKQARLEQLTANSSFRFVKANLADRVEVKRLFEAETYDRVVNLAAQVGPRYSLINPHAYADSNLVGFLNILEGCRQQKVPHLVFASTSSVYGANAKVPFSVEDRVDQPVSLYAATKRANELMAYSYAHLFGLRSTGLRFFTVYGPWGRPDMAPFLFTRALFEGHPIDVFNHGNMSRDFTYIDDVVEIVRRAIDKVPEATPSVANEGQAKTEPGLPLRLYNVGNNSPVTLLDFIKILEEATGKKAKLNFLPLQPGDVPATWADVDGLACDVGFRPQTPLREGLRRFVDWYREFYGV